MQRQATEIKQNNERERSIRRLIRLPEVLRMVGCSRSQWYLSISRGHAPRPIPLGERMRAWDESEVQAFIAERIAERDAQKQAA